jgi:hypothetical protein
MRWLLSLLPRCPKRAPDWELPETLGGGIIPGGLCVRHVWHRGAHRESGTWMAFHHEPGNLS